MRGGGWLATHTDVTQQLSAEKERDSLRQREERRRDIDAAISSFRARVENVLKTVSQSATAMKAAAKSLLTTSDHTLHRAEGAVHGSNEASINVETAATAAAELSGSIKEISRQLARPTRWCAAPPPMPPRPMTTSRRWPRSRRRSATWSSSFRISPARPICWRSTPPSRRRAPARPGAALPWSLPK